MTSGNGSLWSFIIIQQLFVVVLGLPQVRKPMAVAADLLESDSESESDVETCERRHVSETFRALRVPLALQMLAELALLLAVNFWYHKNAVQIAERRRKLDLDPWPRNVFLFPSIFLTCLLGRICAVLSWKYNVCRGKDSQYSALFVLFNCLPWVLYFAVYTRLMHLLTISPTFVDPASQLYQIPRQSVPVEDRIDCVDSTAWRDVSGNSCAYYASQNMSSPTACGLAAGPCGKTCNNCPSIQRLEGGLLKCLSKPNHSYYYCLRGGWERQWWDRCEKAYNQDECIGWTLLPVDYGGTPVKCCVESKTVLERATSDVFFCNFLGLAELSLRISDVFDLSRWVAVIGMTWSFQNAPFLLSSRSSREFISNVWLDLLDCFMFVAHVMEYQIEGPARGFRRDGNPAPEGPQAWRMHLIFVTWLVASVSVVLSPVIYTWFRYREESEACPEPTTEQLLTELAERVKQLDREGAEDMLRRALQKSREEGGQGYAHRHPGEAAYGDSADELEDLSPDSDEDAKAKKSCSGWMDISYLAPDDTALATERRAIFLDACRSCFTLNLPFALFRLWLIWSRTSVQSSAPGSLFSAWLNWSDSSGLAAHLLLLKNGFFGLQDLLTVMACGNKEAVICGYSLAMTSRFPNGRFTSALNSSGPGTLADMAKKYKSKARKRREP